MELADLGNSLLQTETGKRWGHEIPLEETGYKQVGHRADAIHGVDFLQVLADELDTGKIPAKLVSVAEPFLPEMVLERRLLVFEAREPPEKSVRAFPSESMTPDRPGLFHQHPISFFQKRDLVFCRGVPSGEVLSLHNRST